MTNDWSFKRFNFALHGCVLSKFFVIDGQNTHDQIMRGRSKRTWSSCVLCVPFILSGSPNECWLNTCDACVIKTWTLGFWAPFVARKYIVIFTWLLVRKRKLPQIELWEIMFFNYFIPKDAYCWKQTSTPLLISRGFNMSLWLVIHFNIPIPYGLWSQILQL